MYDGTREEGIDYMVAVTNVSVDGNQPSSVTLYSRGDYGRGLWDLEGDEGGGINRHLSSFRCKRAQRLDRQ